MSKKLITMVTTAVFVLSLFTACAKTAQSDSKESPSGSGGKVYAEQSFEGNTGQGILATLINSKGNLVTASQKDGEPLKIAVYDAAGKKTSDVTTDVKDAVLRFAMDAKDQCYALTTAGEVRVLDATGKTSGKIPVKDVLKSGMQSFGLTSGSTSQEAEDVQDAKASKEAKDTSKNPKASTKQAANVSTDKKAPSNQAATQTNAQKQDGQAVTSAQPDETQSTMQMLGSMINGFTASSDGNVYISLMASGVLQIDGSGKLVRAYNAGMLNYICMNEKEQLIVYTMDRGVRKLTTFNTKDGTETAKKDAVLNDPSKFFYDTAAKKLYYLNGDGVYPVKEDGTSGDCIFKLIDISLDSTSSGLSGFAIDKTGSLYIASADNAGSGSYSTGIGKIAYAGGSSNKAGHIDKLGLVDASSVAKKKILTVAGISGSNILNTAIAAFQKKYPDYKVELKTYADEIAGMKQSDKDVDPVSMIQKFNTDIISGNSADVFILDDLPYYKYIEKGILADLNQLIKEDNTDMSGYYANIINACKVNGKLYSIPISFRYTILAGKTANMPSGEKPTVEAFIQKAKALPQGLCALKKEDAAKAFLEYMEDNYGYFLDQTAHTTKFESPEFIKLLNDFKELTDKKMSTVDSDEQDPNEQIGENKLAFVPISLSGAEELSVVKALAGADTVFSKMPAMDQNAYNFNSNGLFGINASSQDRQAAWNFIKILLSSDVQANKLLGGFPVNKSVNTDAIELLKNSDVMGNSGSGGKIQAARMFITTKTKQYEAKPLTNAEYDAVKATMEKLNRLSAPNPNIQKILTEELPAFFSGQKSAKDVASLIQNRVSIILNE